jgi:hypothetical protein
VKVKAILEVYLAGQAVREAPVDLIMKNLIHALRSFA